MTLQDIAAFVAVAETGSINRAALRLNLTQPATTRRIQNFEAALGGAALLDRRAKPPVLTPTGLQVLERCRRVLKAVAELEASAAGAGEPAGELRIGIAHGLADVVLSSPLDDLRRRFPAVRLRVTSNWTTQLIDEVRGGALDCAVGLTTQNHTVPAGVQAAILGTEDVVVVAARETVPRSRIGRVHLAGLTGQSWVLNPTGCGCRAALQRALDQARVPMQVAAEIFGEDLQLALVMRGGLFGLVPRRLLDNSRHRRRLRIVNVADFALPVSITLLHNPSLGNFAAAVNRLQGQIADRLRK
jgi:DNA-binding transcriptional LysR family regulator